MRLAHLPSRRLLGVLGAVAILSATIGVVAAGSIGVVGPDKVVHGCYDQAGDLKVVSYVWKCPRGWTTLNWNQQGVAGVAGPAGPQGPAGPAANFTLTSVTNTEPVHWKTDLFDGMTMVSVICPVVPGRTLVGPTGGGFEILLYSGPMLEVLGSGPTADGTGWAVKVLNTTLGDLAIKVDARCLYLGS